MAIREPPEHCRGARPVVAEGDSETGVPHAAFRGVPRNDTTAVVDGDLEAALELRACNLVDHIAHRRVRYVPSMPRGEALTA